MQIEGDSYKILVIKHGALGDIIQGLDAYASLRKGNPEAHIAIMTTPGFAQLFSQMPWFNEVIIDKRANAINLAQAIRIRSVLRRNWRFIVDMQCSRRTARYHQFFTKPSVSWIGTAKNCSDPLPDFTGVNNRDRMMFCAKCAGGIAQIASLEWLTDAINPSEINETITPSNKFVVFVVGCSAHRPEKRWPARNFGVVGRALVEKGFEILLVGTDADQDMVNEVKGHLPEARNVCGQTSISELTYLFAGAKLVLGNDTGPIFLAAKSGTPTLVLMGSATIPEAMRPNQKNADWIYKEEISLISPEQVLQKIQTKFHSCY